MSLQPVGNKGKSTEATINFFEIDYNKLGQEIAEMQNIREASREVDRSVRLNHPSSGNIYRQQSQNMVPFLDSDSLPEPNREEESTVRASASPKLSAPSSLSTGRSVMSARSGVISDERGPRRQLQSETSNSIWDSERIKRLAKGFIAEEEISDKQQRQEDRRTMRQQRIDDLVEALRGVDTRRDSYVSQLGELGGEGAGSSYMSPNQNLSIFDTFEPASEFSRVAETDGEKLSREVAASRGQKDESWKVANPHLTSSDLVNSLFDKLIMNHEKTR